MKQLLSLSFVLLISIFSLRSQTTVYSILRTSCSNSTCHSASSAEALKFDIADTAMYAAMVNVTPTNTAAVGKYNKIIRPGHPYSSFLLRKCANTLDADISIDANEGTAMTTTASTNLPNVNLELIRQWIFQGAPKSGVINNEAIIDSFYANPTLLTTFLTKLPKPLASDGIQMRIGPLFLPLTGAGSEIEYLLKNEVDLPYDAQVTKFKGSMNAQSHHMLFFRYQDSASAAAKADGLRVVSILGETAFDGNKQLQAAWQYDNEFDLPTGTALFWDKKTFVDWNYHMKNYNTTGGVLPCDFYLNVYFQQRQPGTIQMKSSLQNKVALIIPPYSTSGTDYVSTYDDQSNNNNETRYLWMMASHTHKYGSDFQIKIKNGPRAGDTIYNGMYNQDYTSLQGFYDWHHPAVEYFSPQLGINMQTEGITSVAKYHNTGSSWVTFGLTTNNEMHLYYYMYTTSVPAVGIQNVNASNFDFQVYPNPMNGSGTITYSIKENATVRASIMDVTGREIALLDEETQVPGTHNITLTKNDFQFAKGIYFANLKINGNSYTKKFIVTE